MDSDVKFIIDKFMRENLFEKELITKEEYERLAENGKIKCIMESSSFGIEYYKINPIVASSEELKLILQIKQYEISKKSLRNQRHIRDILIYFFILSLIGLLILILTPLFSGLLR